NAIFPALVQTKLIESRQTSNYHRCGRTDKGVSAFAQVLSITLRSNCCHGVGVLKRLETPLVEEGQDEARCTPCVEEVASTVCTCGKNCSDATSELEYPRLINRCLPDDVRVVAWAPVPLGFSARFDCTARTYHYTLPLPASLNFNLEAVREAAALFKG